MKGKTLRVALATLAILCLAVGTHGVMYSYGSGDSTLHRNDDGYSSQISIGTAFPFFGNTYSSLYVCTNGIISFGGGVSSYTPTPFPISSRPVVAPFWGDVDTRRSGNIYYREYRNGNILRTATSHINAVYSGVVPNFSATWAYIVTWDNVPAYPGSNSNGNSFQAVLATDGNFAFVIYNYENIQWTYGSASGGVSAQVGFDAGNRQNFYAHQWSRSASIANIDDNSNVGTTGRWIFRVDLTEVVPVEEVPQCDAGYTGDGCNECASGYVRSGSNCVVNHCASHSCGNGAACNNGASSYTCTCTAGWLGSRCTTRDYCHGVTCQNGGTCNNGGSGYSCTCTHSYITGTNCQNVNICQRDSISCNNGGACTPSTGACVCTSHFAGTRCDDCANGWLGAGCNTVDYCYGNECQNGATCVNGASGYTCTCVVTPNEAYTGDYCSIRDTCYEQNPDCNQGICANNGPSGGYSCACYDTTRLGYWCGDVCDTCCGGWTGNDCNEVDYCYGHTNCLNGATCVNGPAGYTCTCPYEYTGTHCETRDFCRTMLDDGSREECQNGATCSNQPENFRCDCSDPAHFTNTYCQDCVGGWTDDCYVVDYCYGHTDCLNGGVCVNRPDIETFECDCTAIDYVGNRCEQYDHCTVNSIDCTVRDEGAVCVNGDSWSCDCTPQWDGNLCQQCHDTWTGDDCQLVNYCSGRTCQGGTCVNDFEARTWGCECDPGFTGENCATIDYCYEHDNHNPPNCEGTDSVCTNRPDNTGAFCDYCHDEPCRNGATCHSGLTGYTCTCLEEEDARYYGNNCEYLDYCLTVICQFDGNCTINHQHEDGFECDCTRGRGGKYCEFTDQCAVNECENDQPCSTTSDSEYVCECDPAEYAGTYCELDVGSLGSNAHQTSNNNDNGNNDDDQIAGMDRQNFMLAAGGAGAGLVGVTAMSIYIAKRRRRDEEKDEKDMQREFERQDTPSDEAVQERSGNAPNDVTVEDVDESMWSA